MSSTVANSSDRVPIDPDALLTRFQPILRFTRGEYFLPMAIDDYLPGCRLWRHDDGSRRSLAADIGELDRHRLVELTRDTIVDWSLQFVADPMSPRELIAWRLDHDRPRSGHSSRLGSVGVFGRLIDTAMRLSLVFRGRVAGGTEARAEMLARRVRESSVHTCYGRVLEQHGYIVVQYWFFYPFNDWRSRAYGVNDHEADWEQVTVYASQGSDGSVVPEWVVFSAHDEVGDDLRRRWDDPDLTLVGDQPVVFAGLGSHSGAYLAGDYLLTVDRSALGRLYGVGRRVARLLLPWTRQSETTALGAPYIDYARGDGEVVGEGDRAWRCERIDESTGWVTSYRGLWGHDTSDPFGGERGPAGPRYERTGEVRRSWRDPVGWAGLAKVPPSEQATVDTRRRRLRQIDDEIDELEATCADVLDELRAAWSVQRPVAALERRFDELTSQLDDRREERRSLSQRSSERPAAGPHDHLRHRRLPMTADTTIRHRLLTAWSAISTPLVLLAAALLVLPLGTSVAGVAVGSLLIIFAIEAFARRRLLAYVLGLVTLAVVVAVVGGVAVAILAGWRITVALLLAVAALVVLLLNLAELRRR